MDDKATMYMFYLMISLLILGSIIVVVGMMFM